MQDPEIPLLAMNAKLDCPVRPRNAARIEERYRTIVNHEIWYFGDGNAKKKFDGKPYRWAGLVSDPVTLERFEPTKRSPRSEYNDRLFYFSSDSTRTVFESDPETYWLPRREMASRPDSTATPENGSS